MCAEHLGARVPVVLGARLSTEVTVVSVRACHSLVCWFPSVLQGRYNSCVLRRFSVFPCRVLSIVCPGEGEQCRYVVLSTGGL